MSKNQVIDLHCDLLSYLAVNPSRTPHDKECPCALGYLEKGGVSVQVLAAFMETAYGSTRLGKKQVEIFRNLRHPTIQFHLAIENGSTLFEEEGKLTWPEALPPVLYLSLTWNTENRFGGGASTSIGLKEDGRWLLREMNERGIAVDLSHASDRLAEEILKEIDRKGYTMPIVASHSNARAVCPSPRNLPDHLIKEIVDRRGLIGINLYKKFLGDTLTLSLQKHVEHFRKLRAENCLAWGADFFYLEDLSEEYRHHPQATYFKEASNASCYPALGLLFEESFRCRLEKENFNEWKK